MANMSPVVRRLGFQPTRRERIRNTLWLFAAAVALASVLVGLTGAPTSDAAQQKTPGPSWYTNGTVWDLVRVGDVIYAGGDFTEVRNDAGQTMARSNVAAFHVLTGEVQPWNPTVDGPVLALEASPDGSHIYLGGDFRNVNGTYRQRLAAVDILGQLKTGFRADTGGRVLDLIHHGDQLLVAGEVVSIAGRSRTLVGRVDQYSGALDQDWVPSIDGGSVRGINLSPDGQHLYIGGNFFSVDRRSNTAYAARLSMTSGRVDGNWRPGLDMPIFDIEPVNDVVYLAVAGPGYENNRLQKHAASDGAELLRYLADGDLQDLEVHGDTMFVGGHFTRSFGGLPRSQLAAINLADDHITSFDPTVVTIYGVWKALAGSEGIWLAGEFTEVEGVTRQGLALLPNDGGPEPGEDVLLPRSANWRYHDNGSAPSSGSQWAQSSFDDRTWSIGGGEFGFGDDDEQTVIGETDSFYARTIVAVQDPMLYRDVTVRLLADAGAAVYVNGHEATRHNLPEGTLSNSTRAVAGKWGTSEKIWIETTVPATVFQAGDNTVAVQVHGYRNDSSDMSFQLELIGNGGDGVVDPNPNPDPDPEHDPEPDPDPEPEPGPDPVRVIAAGDRWSYLDDGSLTGTQWRNQDYDDGGWLSGLGQFGFGDGDEVTVLESGHPVYWFRKNVELASAPAQATLRLVVDDGTAVYVNGTEVARVNLPDGVLDGQTKALGSRWGTDERDWLELAIDPALLRAGGNTVAVTVHNVWSGNSDLSFDMELTVTGSVDPDPDPEPDPDPDPDPEPDPGPDPGPVTLVGADALWRYLDDGSEPGTAWTEIAFNDRRWSEGLGQFGFGEGDETTVLQSGYRSYFLRHTFAVDQIPAELVLSMLFDDGVSVHLNGQEVSRLNIGDGPVTSHTQALGSRWGSDETTLESIIIDPALLVAGDNVLAISLHNVWSGNSDLSLDAQLVAEG